MHPKIFPLREIENSRAAGILKSNIPKQAGNQCIAQCFSCVAETAKPLLWLRTFSVISCRSIELES